ncbi:MAG: hypothetical protein ACYC1D_09110 [Acidimicrobiales bacterium]
MTNPTQTLSAFTPRPHAGGHAPVPTAEPASDEPIDSQVEFISVPEWCRRVGCSLDAGYRAARRNEIAGLFRIGRLMRVNWQAFVAATFVASRIPDS